MHVGRLVGLWRYPVKSMAAESLTEAQVTWHGISGDRRWAFIRPNIKNSGFPWLTIRQNADMRKFAASFADPDRPDASPTVVRTPGGEEYDVTDDALARRLGEGVRVIKQDVGIFDSLPLSLITTRTLTGLTELTGRTLEAQRFRPNLLVEPTLGDSFPEETWVGRILRIGDMRMRVDRRDPRCAIVTVDPQSGQRDPDVLRSIAQHRDNCAGVYGTTVTPGRVRLGAPVLLELDATPG
jgi:MOSC domain-containing protein